MKVTEYPVLGFVLIVCILTYTTCEGYAGRAAAEVRADIAQAKADSLDHVVRADSIRSDSLEAKYDSVSAKVDSIAEEARRIREAAARQRAQAEDSIRAIRAYADTMASVDSATFRRVADDYETVIEQQDITITSLSSELYEERQARAALAEAYAAVQVENGSLRETVSARDAVIAALRDQNNGFDLLGFIPDGTTGDLLVFGVGVLVGSVR